MACNNEGITDTSDDLMAINVPADIIPQININTRGKYIVDKPKIDATMTNTVNDIATYNDTLLLESGSMDANYNKWPILNTYVWPNAYIGADYDEELTYFKDWISKITMAGYCHFWALVKF